MHLLFLCGRLDYACYTATERVFSATIPPKTLTIELLFLYLGLVRLL